MKAKQRIIIFLPCCCCACEDVVCEGCFVCRGLFVGSGPREKIDTLRLYVSPFFFALGGATLMPLSPCVRSLGCRL